MLIPISIRNKDNKLVVHHNKGTSIVDYPFKPFILLEKEFFSDVPGQIVSLTKVPQEEKTDYIKAEFFSYNELLDFKKRNQDKSNKMLSNSILEQIYIIQPDFFKAFPHNTDLKILYFDIEIATKGDDLFPKFTTNEILCIGYSVWSYDNGQKKKLIQGICKNYDEKNCSDKEILEEFFDIIQKYDPDIIAGYNSEDFDLPYVIGRAGLLNINTKRVGRGGAPYTHIQENKEHLFIPGRIHFDIYSSNAGVFKDQTLSGIKSKTLKDVARWFKIKKTIKANDQWIEESLEDIEVQDHIENLKKLYNENKELLYKYQDDDVYRTEAVGNIYIRNVITLAEMMGTSLESIINMYSSFIPKLFLARNMHTLGLICTETNFQRYNIYTGTIAKLSKDLKFEGAISELYRDGYFNNVWKIDFAAMYPSIIQSLNLGPDTTKLISVESYTGKYSHSEDENYHWYNIPSAFDKEAYKYNLVVRVNKKDGFLKKSLSETKSKRKALKKEEKAATDESVKAALYSQQWAIKILQNSVYGILSLKTSIYGDLVSGIMTTSIGRWCTFKMCNRLKDHLIEVDTDGYVIDFKQDAAIETNWLGQELKKKFNVTDNYLVLESEGNGERAYFYLAKNYIIEKSIGDYNIHGSSLKGSKSSKVVDRAVKLGIEYIFNNKPIEEVLNEAYDFTGLSIDDFIERAKMTKEKNDYDDQQDFRLFIAKQVELKTGQIVTSGTQMNFVVAKKPLPYSEFKEFYKGNKKYYTFAKYIDNISELDFSYYNDQIDKTLAKFGISKNNYITLNLFGDQQDKKPINKSKKLDIIYEGEL